MSYTKASFQLPFGILNISQEPNDLRYGPYIGIGTSVGETFHTGSPLTVGNRYTGLTVGVFSGGEILDYWFKSGILDIDLVLKTSSGGDKYFIFDQSASISIWNVSHGLNKLPSVTVVDSAGTTVMGRVDYIDENNLKITFSVPFKGKAYLN